MLILLFNFLLFNFSTHCQDTETIAETTESIQKAFEINLDAPSPDSPDDSTTIHPFKTDLDIGSLDFMVIKSDGTDEKTSQYMEEIPWGIPYRAQIFRNEQEALLKNPFPSLNKPYTIQSELQEKAEDLQPFEAESFARALVGLD